MTRGPCTKRGPQTGPPCPNRLLVADNKAKDKVGDESSLESRLLRAQPKYQPDKQEANDSCLRPSLAQCQPEWANMAYGTHVKNPHLTSPLSFLNLLR